MKTAIVHDWLVTDAGAEKVLAQMVKILPDADIFSLVDFLDDEDRERILGGREAGVTFIQHLPFAEKRFRNYLPLFPLAISSLDMSDYDLILSSSWAFAKGVKKREDATHLCYCHTPIRYAWDLFDEYTADLSQPKRAIVRSILRHIRSLDRENSKMVDRFIANSSTVADRILRHYGRESDVIHPPVDTDFFTLHEEKEDFYLTASRLVPYKKSLLIAEAFADMPDRRLVIAGGGEEYEKIASLGAPNITLTGHISAIELRNLMQRARAFVFASFEDFGIAPVEAMSTGTPVIAYGEGGILDSVTEGVSGIFFHRQSREDIADAIGRFERLSFDPARISRLATRFSTENFTKRLSEYIDNHV
jgi:glycosyltransferase involved in cell wall biosynthesis